MTDEKDNTDSFKHIPLFNPAADKRFYTSGSNDLNLPVIPKINTNVFYTDADQKRILDQLDSFREMISHTEDEDEQPLPQFPSVCLVGFGRCGSNIALNVAKLVYEARQLYLLDDEEKMKALDNSGSSFLSRLFQHSDQSSHFNPLFLIEPIVMLGDLDKDIRGRIAHTTTTEKKRFLQNYRKMQIMNLAEIHAGGAGNAPILGQYLAKIILQKNPHQFSDYRWKDYHSYLIDSCGIKANQSRLFFYIFSAGGGTGSGMASEFGMAQQYAYMSKTFQSQQAKSSKSQRQSFVFEPIFSAGICILPNLSRERLEISEALYINTGRLLCKYLSEEWDFSYNHPNHNQSGHNTFMDRLRPWNAMLLISNDIMRYAEENNDQQAHGIDVNRMERYANEYISQQIFNILTAQALTSDYDEDYFKQAGIDIADTIRLDANDLFMSLAGPVGIAYAEMAVHSPTQQMANGQSAARSSEQLNINDLLVRALSLPHFNELTNAIEGISLLPTEAELYRQMMKDYQDNHLNPEVLKELPFFENCSSVVTIISLPKNYRFSYSALNQLKYQLNGLFPNTTLKRYALVMGASKNISLTILIAKSPCLSDDFITLMVAYIKRCFTKTQYQFTDAVENAIINYIHGEDIEDHELASLLFPHEDPSKILDTNWQAIKPMYERKYRELLPESDFISIDDIRLDIDTVLKAIKYIKQMYNHKISKISALSLTKRRKATNKVPVNSIQKID
ncbi:MAG: hypothetical protein OXE99_05135 [Cellvibrionales bacterium]|nr:hypothetical protein [Cellvibrionales bacterium]